jgi:hypothetical protein
MAHIYSADFYDYINSGSRTSARTLIPLLRSALPIDSLLDIGAGQGAWAAEWQADGVSEVVAVDGLYAGKENLLIPQSSFVGHDLSQPLDLGRRFDLVQSLEVAEHIAEDRAECFVETLTMHGDVVLFSAAVPNQGGEHHVNEQFPEYWRHKFGKRGYAVYDWLRPQLRAHSEVEPWYRYNALLYANEAGQKRLAADVLATRVADDATLVVGGSLPWHLRRGLVGLMPAGLANWIAMANAHRKARAMRLRTA